MHPKQLRDLLTKVSGGEISVDDAYKALSSWPFHDAGDALLDVQREARSGERPKWSIARGNGPSR